MSQQAGPSTSTEGEINRQQHSQSQQHQQQHQQQQFPQQNSQLPFGLPQFSSLDPATQQAILQQIAAARGAGNPAAAAFLANLNTAARKARGGNNASGTSAGAPNGSAPSPNFSFAGAPPNPTASAPSPSAGSDVAALQAQLQQRLLLAQHQALQAAAQRQATGGPQQQQHQQQQQPPTPSTDGPRPPSAGLPDWAAAAAANGMLANLGSDREAIIKQLQALQQSQQNRAKHAASLAGVGSPVNPSAPSPAMTAPSPAASLSVAPSPAPSADASAPTPISTNFATETSAPSPGIMSALAAAARPPGTPTAPGPMAPGIRPGLVRIPKAQQQGLLNSMMQYFKSTGQPLPTEVFNGERDGSFKLGDAWIDLPEFFLTVFRLGGLFKLMQGSNGQTIDPAEHPVWQHVLVAKGVPFTLAAPIALPRLPPADPNAPPQMTTNASLYLATAYRAWLFGFEQAMTRTKLAAFQKHQAAAAAAGAGVRPPGVAGTPGATPGATPATPTAAGPPLGVPTPTPAPDATKPAGAALASSTPGAPSPQVTKAPTPVAAAPTPPITNPTPPAVAAPSPAAPTLSAPTPVPPTPDPAVSVPSPAVPTPPHAESPAPAAGTPGSNAPTPLTINGTPPADGPKQKRKRDAHGKGAAAGRVSTPASAKSEGTSRQKRPRYRVEYRPLHFPHPNMGGWEERTIAQSFPKNQIGRPTRPAQELQVDVEAVLMGLRSRIPREIGYGLTVLSMLSMPLNEGKSPNLPIEPLIDVYLEVLDLIAEYALGDEDVSQWLEEQQQATPEASSSHSSASRDCVDRMTYTELEQLGCDTEYVVEDEDGGVASHDTTGGKTDIILSGLNIIRNFSMFADNRPHMARPELFNTLAALCNRALMRLPGEQSSRPYSVLEYARVCRDVVSIIANLGSSFDLRAMPKTAVLAIYRLLSGFLVCAWEVLQKREPGYGPTVSIRQVPPTAILSIDRALEAFCCLTLPDHNREAIAAAVPSDELVELFAALVKLFPLSAREIEALRSMEDYLARVEMVALSVYSLAFLAPQMARSGMRATAGSTAVMTRMVYGLAPHAPDLKTSPFGILVRRVAETLGVLNGTVNPGGNADRMSFSAGGVDGKGWRFASDSVEPGWLAHDADRVLEAMGWGRGDGRIWRVDGPTFAELDGLWSA